jgi:hypothetical protein
MGEVELGDLQIGPDGRDEHQRQGYREEDELGGVGEDVVIQVPLEPGRLAAHAVAVQDEGEPGEEYAEAAGHVDEDVGIPVPEVQQQVRHYEEQRQHEDQEAQRGDEPLPLVGVGQHPVHDVERALDSRDLLDVDLDHGVDVGARRYDRIDELVLGAVPHEYDAVRLDLGEDRLELLDEVQVGLVADLVVPAYQGHLGVSAVCADVHAGLDRRVEGVCVGILRVGHPQRGGRLLAPLDPYDGGGDPSLLAEIVIPVHGQNESPPHEPLIVLHLIITND